MEILMQTPEPEAQIAARLRRLRDSRNLSNAQIADQLGLTEGGVKQIMQGVASKQMVKLADLARVLGATPNDILGFSQDSPVSGEYLRAVLETTLINLDVPETEAREGAQSVVAMLGHRPAGIHHIDDVDIARIQTGSVVRRLARGRSSAKLS
jgi:transcriptional regulator with XRE-family HTH domain